MFCTLRFDLFLKILSLSSLSMKMTLIGVFSRVFIEFFYSLNCFYLGHRNLYSICRFSLFSISEVSRPSYFFMLASVMPCIMIDLSIESFFSLICLSSFIVLLRISLTSFSSLPFTLVSLFRFSSRFCYKTFEYESCFLISFSIFSSTLFISSIFFCKFSIDFVSVSSFFLFLHRLVKLNFKHLLHAIFTVCYHVKETLSRDVHAFIAIQIFTNITIY